MQIHNLGKNCIFIFILEICVHDLVYFSDKTCKEWAVTGVREGGREG